MGFRIEDGLGTGSQVGISPTGNRFNVSSRSDDRIYYISRDNGKAFTATSTDTAAADEYNFYFKNTSTSEKFYVHSITVGSAAVARFKVATVTGVGGTAGAIAVTNLNVSSPNVAAATCLGNGAVSDLTEAGVVATASVPLSGSVTIPFFDSFVLGQGDQFAVETDITAGATVHITMLGYYDVE